MRNINLSENEHYHVFNRGVDKRLIILDKKDLDRFVDSIKLFNNIETIGSLRDRPRHRVSGEVVRLVNIIAYSINPNHFHFILKQVSEKGIEKFMHKVGMGYAKYFNTRHKRTGALFQGKFKAKLIDSNEYLLHLSTYVNLNHVAHARGPSVPVLSKTSWGEYLEKSTADRICDPSIVLGQFKNPGKYREFAESGLKSIVDRKILLEELEDAGIELIK